MIDSVLYEDGKTFLTSTLQRLIGVLGAQSGSLFLFNQRNNELVLSAYYNAKGFVLTDIKKQIGEGVAGCVVKIRRPILVHDIDEDPGLTAMVCPLPREILYLHTAVFRRAPDWTHQHYRQEIRRSVYGKGPAVCQYRTQAFVKRLAEQRALVEENTGCRKNCPRRAAGSSST